MENASFNHISALLITHLDGSSSAVRTLVLLLFFEIGCMITVKGL
jgi:hypothetical protein